MIFGIIKYYLFKSRLSLRIDQINKSNLYFLIPQSSSKLPNKFYSKENTKSTTQSSIQASQSYKLSTGNANRTIEQPYKFIKIFETDNAVKDIFVKQESNYNKINLLEKNASFAENYCFKNKNKSLHKKLFAILNLQYKPQDRLFSTLTLNENYRKTPKDNLKKLFKKTDSYRKFNNLCERLPKKSKTSGENEPNIIKIESEEDKYRQRLESGTIILENDPDYSLVNGVPIEITCWRKARIYQPRKNPMQSGTRHIGHWELAYDSKGRWENPLMGWTSSGDAVASVVLKFSTKEEAINYCVNNNMEYYVQESKIHKKFKPKSYGINFHFKNRTRLSTK